MFKSALTYLSAIVAAAVIFLLAAALFPMPACSDASQLTAPFKSNAWAQSASPDQPVTPATPPEGQNAIQSAPAQTAPTVTPPVEPSQPISGQTPSEQKKPEAEEPAKETTIFDVVHGELSRGLLSSATWIDSFFGDRRYLSELNQSYVRFRYNVFAEHESPLLRRPELQVRIVLPQLKEKTHLEFSGTPKDTADLSATQAPSATDQFENPTEKNVAATVSHFFQDTKRVNFVVRAGLQWHKGGPVVILGPRLRLLFPLDHWSFRIIEEIILRNDTGYQMKTTFDLERPLSSKLFFRATNDWIRTDHVDGYIYTLIFNVDHPLDTRHVLSYEYVNIFQTQPVNELTEIDLRVRYRQRIWRDWLYFEVAPQYRFPRDRAFEPTPGILFRIDAIFGHY